MYAKVEFTYLKSRMAVSRNVDTVWGSRIRLEILSTVLCQISLPFYAILCKAASVLFMPVSSNLMPFSMLRLNISFKKYYDLPKITMFLLKVQTNR